MSTQLVWFKRDLRINDHRPLTKAAQQGPCVGIFVYEPELLTADDYEAAHLEFLNQSLAELRKNLRARGGELLLRTGRLPDVFDELLAELPFSTIWAHEETSNHLAYMRDRRVRRWTRQHNIQLVELPHNGVVRRLPDRDQWSRLWRQRIADPPCPPPSMIRCPPIDRPGELLDKSKWRMHDLGRTHLQTGGESAAEQHLHSFLNERGENYRSEMSSPVTAFESCSRISPYLAFGNLSLRSVYHRLQTRIEEIQHNQPPSDSRQAWLKSLSSFQSRLHWHCHFIQKLEDEPSIEFENINRGFDGLREDAFDEEKFQAWCDGRTGYPLIDACMRALREQGWINFRMRAMLVSFASYQLWLHWRKPALHLARLFLDYETGIHYSQVQMQSGVTGINTVRIYSPIKQVADQDPSGTFIRRYVPELADVPDELLAEPHRMTAMEQTWSRCRIGVDYPLPIVEHADAYRTARDRIFAARQTPAVRQAARQVYQKHGSRKQPFANRQ